MSDSPMDQFLPDDRPREECGVFGIYGHKDAAQLTALGLHALQHRGQEAAGVVTCDQGHFYTHRALGLVGDHFSSQAVMDPLVGQMAIGHVRYSTTGDTLLRNVQPIFADFAFGGMAIAHNGNLTNARAVRKTLVARGCLFQSTMDTEIIIHLVAISLYTTVVDRMIDALRQLEGAYSLVALTRKKLIGVRDPLGVRPLVIGKLGDSLILTSETCALDIIGAEFIRDVEPGEIVVIDENGLRSIKPFGSSKQRFCIFEYVYFARPDSVMEGHNVYGVRKQIGKELARESHVEADMIVPVPDSGVPAALGYAEESGIPFDLGIIRNHYVGRTFIEPTDRIRHLGVRLKHNANAAYLAGKRVVLVDDSIVRGTTSIKIVEMVRSAGAAEVHMRISSPPTNNSCFYGIDTPKKEQLLASQMDLEAMAKHIGVDSLAFLSFDGLYRAVGESGRDPESPCYCDACFTGEYPTKLTDHSDSNGMPEQLTLLTESR
ncbi:amidophosphoribosyltransferase [Magnetospira sp. QH-2]|uniref:amidophosphoribosyltransferase n=1 Tax=Magnetospira sp. (strain QH-2) TaxID=1288970 RepID=UPI0003E81BB1|nr:amidophosphoribosyltransferase [Magnetospira sp. QH-2]CCQ74070.1 Amidophosphoribosyltransferase precursor (Glutamine phosphoribosylpyrophosphate amidotransferase) (ATASE) (GPATase) [Magnetospira sp. QH-2]